MGLQGATVIERAAERIGARAAGGGRRAIGAGRAWEDRMAAGVLVGARLRWPAATLDRTIENLPPFWVVFLLIVAVGLQPAMLVLPLAVAAIGLLPGLLLLIAVGGVSLLTMASMAGAAARCRPLRYGCAFLGLLVEDYLGPDGSRLVAWVCIARTFLILLVPILGLALTLTSLFGLPPEVWTGLLLLLILCRLYQQKSRFSATAMVALGAINLGMLLILSLIAFAHLQPAHLPLIAAASLRPAALSTTRLGAGLGVFLCCYTGHLSVLQGARVTLPRDPDGRALIRGTIAATAFVTICLCLWTLAVNRALPAAVLVGERGTVLVPLAVQFGPSVSVLGSVFACLLLGRSALNASELLFYLARERLPARATQVGDRCPHQGRRPWHRPRGRFGLGVLPTVIAFGVVELLLRLGVRSFTEVTSVVGLLTVTTSGGVLPLLLLQASRRKGAAGPRRALLALEQPLVAGGLYLFFIGVLLAHGLFLWKAPTERAVALGTAAVTVAATGLLVRRGAFAPRLVLELRLEPWREGAFAPRAIGYFEVLASGVPVPAAVRLEYASGAQHLYAAAGEIALLPRLQGAEFRLPVARVRELKVWVHRVTPEGSSEGQAGVLEVECGGATRQFSLGPSGGKVLLPVTGESCRVWITLAVAPA
jgi:amino acid permease